MMATDWAERASPGTEFQNPDHKETHRPTLAAEENTYDLKLEAIVCSAQRTILHGKAKKK